MTNASAPPGAAGRPIVLVVTGQVVLAEDLCQTLAEALPFAEVVHRRSEDEALADPGPQAVRLAFLTGTDEAAEAGLAEAIEAAGGRIVLLVENAATASIRPGRLCLQMPFTTAQVLALLAGLMPTGGAPPALPIGDSAPEDISG